MRCKAIRGVQAEEAYDLTYILRGSFWFLGENTAQEGKDEGRETSQEVMATIFQMRVDVESHETGQILDMI